MFRSHKTIVALCLASILLGQPTAFSRAPETVDVETDITKMHAEVETGSDSAAPSRIEPGRPSALIEPATRQKENTRTNNESKSPEAAQPEDVEPPTDTWTRLYNAGLKSAQKRIFEDAETKLLAAIKEAKRLRDDQKLIYARNALADVYCQKDEFREAEKLYESVYAQAQRVFGKESEEVAHAAYGLAFINYTSKYYAKADSFAKQSLAIRKKLPKQDLHALGQTYVLMGLIAGNQGWTDESEPLLARGLWDLEKSPGYKQLDLADALRLVALYRQARGRRTEAQRLFEKSTALTEAAIAFDKPSSVGGLLRFRWEPGSHASQEIPDNDFPLKYINVGGIRVAATVVDLWELMGILVCITNTGTQRADLGLGAAKMVRTSIDPHDTSIEKLTFVDPYHIDRIRRERIMWDLTYTRPWLANIQKTRNARGFVPPHGHDLFRGPNIFGVYGEWGAMSRSLPEKFAVEPSPERVQYQAQEAVDTGLIHSNNMRILGLVPVSLEPFESRTGELFYLHPRCESVRLTVQIGNTCFEIPFKLRKKRIN